MTNDAGVSSSLDGSRNARQPRKTRFPRSIISSSTPRWHHGTSPSSAWEGAVKFLRFQVLGVLYKASSMSPCPRTLLGQVSTSPTFLGDHIASLFTISRAFFWSYLHLDIIWVTLTQRILLSFRLDRNNLETQWEETHIIVICNGDWKWRHICCCHVAGSNLLSNTRTRRWINVDMIQNCHHTNNVLQHIVTKIFAATKIFGVGDGVVEVGDNYQAFVFYTESRSPLPVPM